MNVAIAKSECDESFYRIRFILAVEPASIARFVFVNDMSQKPLRKFTRISAVRDP